jgi:uncharacterized protein YkwD
MTRPRRIAHRSRRPAVGALIAVLGLLATFLVATAPDAAAAPVLPRRTAYELHIDYVVASMINGERAAHRLPPLRLDAELCYSARWHNVTMAKWNQLSHQLPGEMWYGGRIWYAGFHWSWAGENIAWNSIENEAGVVALQHMMYNERPPYDAHRLNILNSHYRDVGVDVYFDSRHHKVWLTTDFGRRR